MSNAALTSGLEWNVKVTEKDSFDIITKFNATFETYWNDEEFTSYTGSEQDEQKLKIALKKEDFNNEGDDNYFTFDIRPYYYQKEILEQLQAERKLFNRYKNLIVAATGERVIIVMGAINVLKSRVSGTFTEKFLCIAYSN